MFCQGIYRKAELKNYIKLWKQTIQMSLKWLNMFQYVNIIKIDVYVKIDIFDLELLLVSRLHVVTKLLYNLSCFIWILNVVQYTFLSVSCCTQES